jgi:hypothetical protein
MTESEWQASTNPEPLLLFLKGKVTERKLRLVACASCRRIWHLLDAWMQDAIEGAEQHFDGSVSQSAANFAAAQQAALVRTEPYSARHIAAGILGQMLGAPGWAVAWNTVSEVRRAMRASSPAGTYEETKYQAAVTKDIFGNPFRPVTIDPAWLAWREGTVARLAQGAYDELASPGGHLDVARLAILADALEECGCGDPHVLEHLRGPVPHVRGCHVLDAILGRK